MTEKPSRSRERAERAFAQTQNAIQPQFFARSEALAEQDEIQAARDAKTARLREARLARDSAYRQN
jgi:hypothetical protein